MLKRQPTFTSWFVHCFLPTVGIAASMGILGILGLIAVSLISTDPSRVLTYRPSQHFQGIVLGAAVILAAIHFVGVSYGIWKDGGWKRGEEECNRSNHDVS